MSVRSTAEATAYDAFISYSHAVDGKLAPALQSALQRFSKPWYRPRALRVFRDNASLSANPALWSSIESALGQSRWFVLLASPGSAASPWVAREVEAWLGAHGTERLLVAVTDGELSWDAARGGFAPGPQTAVPEALLTAFAEEPRFIDLRWARTGEHLSLSDPRFRDAVADLAAPIHDRPKDDLVGEEVRQHRRAVRLARAGVATLAILLVAAAVAAVLAVSQRNEARTQREQAELQRDRAEEEARIATSRQLAAQATAVRDEQYDLALLLAVEAYRTQATAEARSTLTSTLESNPRLATFIGLASAEPGAAPAAVAFSPDGDLLAVATGPGVTLWGTSAHRIVRRLRSPTESPLGSLGAQVAFSDDGRLIAAAALTGEVTVWETATGDVRHRLELEGSIFPASIAFGPEGTHLAVAYGGTNAEDEATPTDDVPGTTTDPSVEGGSGQPPPLELPDLAPTKPGQLVVWSLLDEEVQIRAPTEFLNHVAIDETLSSVEGGAINGRTVSFDLASGKELEPGGTPTFTLSSAFSDDGRLYAYPNDQGGVTVHDLETGADMAQLGPTQRQAYGTMAFSDDGTRLAAAGGGAATVWRLDRPRSPVHLRGFGAATSDLALSHDGSELAVVSGARVAHFDLDRRFRLAEEVLVPDIYVPTAVTTFADVAFSGDGRFVSWLHPGTLPNQTPSALIRVLVRDLRDGSLRADIPLHADPDAEITFTPDGARISSSGAVNEIALSPDGSLLAVGGDAVHVHTLAGGMPRLLVESGDELVERLDFSPDGSLLTVVRSDGSIARHDVTTGEPLVEIASGFGFPVIAVGQAGRIVRLADSLEGALVESDLDAPDPDPRPEGDGTDAAVIAVGPGTLRALAFTDGLVSVNGGAVEGFRFRPAGPSTSGLAFAPDGRSLVAAASNGIVAVWDLETKAEVARLNVRNPGDQAAAVALRPAGEPMVAIAAVDGSLTLWRVGIEAALTDACKVAARNLSVDEWDRYVGSRRPRTKTCPAYPLDDQP